MSRVSTNTISIAYAIEASLATLPGTPQWKLIEPNEINTFGPTISTVARNPIAKDRQRKKGTITDLDSAVEFNADLTGDHITDFFNGFMFAEWTGGGVWGEYETEDVTAVTATGYTVTDDGDLAADELIYARGFTNSANNGLKVVGAASTTTEIKVSGLVVEAAPPDEARIEIAGVQGATGDLEIDASGDLISTVLDLSALGLTVGQVIWVGGSTTVTQFAVAANTGFARITAIAAAKLTLDKTAATFTIDNGATKTIQILFGRFLRNVPVDDGDFLEQSYQFEATYPDLDSVGVDEYEYAKGNYCNQLVLNLPLSDKATCDFGFTGTDTEPPSTNRDAESANAIDPIQTEAFNTSADIARLRITQTDETELTSYFKTLTLTVNNNVTPEKVLANLGAVFMNIGNFDITIEAQVLFTDSGIPTAIRNNTTLTMDFSLENSDGGLFFDFPAITIGGGDKEYPENETVLMNTPASAFEDPTLGYSLSISHFPYLP